MKFEPGKIIDEFEVDGKKVIFRYPKKDDVDGLMNYLNSMIENKEYLGRLKKVNRQDEVKWLRGVFRDMKKSEKLIIVVELNGVIVGNCYLRRSESDATKHVSDIGIGLMKEAQDKGIGTRLLKCAEKQSKYLNAKILTIEVFSVNKRAWYVYEKKLGYKYVGRIPNYNYHFGKYYDRIIFYKEVPK